MNTMISNPILRTVAKPTNAFDLLFNDLPVRNLFSNQWKNTANVPAANVRETKENFMLELAAPGMEKSDFIIKVDGDTLVISAAHKEEKSEEGSNYTRKEFHYGKFTRSFILPETVNEQAIVAGYDKGVLSITLPKKQEVVKETSRSIEVA